MYVIYDRVAVPLALLDLGIPPHGAPMKCPRKGAFVATTPMDDLLDACSAASEDSSAAIPCFQCTICSKVFSTESGLKNHAPRHGPKECVCSVCDYAFVRRDELKRHMRKHTRTAKPYIYAPSCNNPFSSLIIDEPVAICPVEGCGASFIRTDHFRNHMTMKHPTYSRGGGTQ